MILRSVVLPLLALSCMQAPATAGAPGSALPPATQQPPESNPSSSSPSVATELVRLTNAERASAGRPALAVNAKLMRAAQLQADQMAALSHMDHVLPSARYPRPVDRINAVGYDWRSFGENIAYGAPDAAATMRNWMNSPGHRQNIMSREFTEIGVGYASDTAGRPYYAQVFGRPR
jgi:uncharacterized protein YkwD